MSKRLSKLYGLDIYSIDGQYVGKIEEVLLNLEEGVVMSIYLRSLSRSMSNSAEVRKIISEEGIGFDDINSIGDIVLTKSKPKGGKQKMMRRQVSDGEEPDYAF